MIEAPPLPPIGVEARREDGGEIRTNFGFAKLIARLKHSFRMVRRRVAELNLFGIRLERLETVLALRSGLVLKNFYNVIFFCHWSSPVSMSSTSSSPSDE